MFVGAMLRSAATPPVTRKREFWVLMGYAVALGVFGAFAALVYLGAIKFGSRWGADFRPGWFGGHWWWVGVTAAAGVVVGLLRRLTRLPEEVPGLFDDLRADNFDTRLVPGVMAVSAVSLIGGASVGPEKVLASMGAGAGSWMARRRGLDEEDSQVNALAGIAGIFGGLFSSPVIVVMLILEIARPGGQRLAKALLGTIVASSVSFGIYFVIVHQVIPGVPLGLAFTCLLAAVPGGVVSAPFTMVLLAAFLTQVGALQTAPILIAVITAFLAMEGVKYMVASRKQANTAAAEQTGPPSGHSVESAP